MMDIRNAREYIRRADEGARDERVVCIVDYQQFSRAAEPHFLTRVATVLVNEQEVGFIEFTGASGESKEKSIRLDITQYLTEPLNAVQIQIIVDRDVVQEGFHSEADFRLRVGGSQKVKEHYETRLPLRVVNDGWLLIL